MPTNLPPETRLREPGSMEIDPTGDGIAVDETRRLIASNKVEGTAVFAAKGEELGSVYNFMVDKFTGQVGYVVMSFGGFLGIGERYHPLPWKALTYDTRLGGYIVDLDQDPWSRRPATGPRTIPSPIPTTGAASTTIIDPPDPDGHRSAEVNGARDIAAHAADGITSGASLVSGPNAADNGLLRRRGRQTGEFQCRDS